MELIFLWITTVIASFGMDFANGLRMFKDVADAGYKIDTKRLNELSKQLNPNAPNTTLLSLLVPIVNIWQVFKKTIQYNEVRPMVLDQLNIMDCIEEMSELEKEEYEKKPTGLNAFLIPLKTEIRLSKAQSIKIKNGNDTNEIIYEMGKTIDDIVILKVNGPAARLSIEEQKQMIVDAWKNIFQTGVEKYGNIGNLLSELSNSKNINLSSDTDSTIKDNTTHSTHNLSASEKIQELEKLKNEILEGEKEEDEKKPKQKNK